MMLLTLRMTEEMKRLSLNGFQECFQHLYSRWQKCIVAQGRNFGDSVTQSIVLLCICQKQSNSGNILNLPRTMIRLLHNWKNVKLPSHNTLTTEQNLRCHSTGAKLISRELPLSGG